MQGRQDEVLYTLKSTVSLYGFSSLYHAERMEQDWVQAACAWRPGVSIERDACGLKRMWQTTLSDRERRWSCQCVAYSALWVKQSAQLSNHPCFRWCSVSRANVMVIPRDPWMNLGTSHAPRCASHNQSVSSIDGSPICLSLMLKKITITENVLGHKLQ